MSGLPSDLLTLRVLASKAFKEECGQECIDWASHMLEVGNEGHSLCILAGVGPPLNHFEIASLRDRALIECGIPELTSEVVFRKYAKELLRVSLHDDARLIDALRAVKDICENSDSNHGLFEFFRLYFAYSDLLVTDIQHYWPGANRGNIMTIIRQHVTDFTSEGDA